MNGTNEARVREAAALMNAFSERTGLSSSRQPDRYLWTDAFAVCNDLGLARITGEAEYRDRALKLINRVHHTLGRHREDDPRHGWISGLPADEGERHPTAGGLRIGKELPERGADEPYDPRLEWDRDGQYFHYLTKWMHALDLAARTTRERKFSLWARELAVTAFRAFVYRPDSTADSRRMYWKMSVDLTRPLVPSMGQHDPLDGYVTGLQLHATASQLQQDPPGPDLSRAIDAFSAMTARNRLHTDDPLGLGGLLIDAYRLQQILQQQHDIDQPAVESLLDDLLYAARDGLRDYVRSGGYRLPAEYRLAFRELGLAIGLHAVERMQQNAPGKHRDRLEKLAEFLPLRDAIVHFWRRPEQQQSESWRAHRNINDVMLATGLVPEGCLTLREVASGE